MEENKEAHVSLEKEQIQSGEQSQQNILFECRRPMGFLCRPLGLVLFSCRSSIFLFAMFCLIKLASVTFGAGESVLDMNFVFNCFYCSRH